MNPNYKKRQIPLRHVISYLVYHHSRSAWLTKQKRKEDAAKHQADFELAWNEATLNERATVDFITKQTSTPQLPHVKGYEPYPLPLRPNLFASKWPKEGRRGINFWLPTVILNTLSEKTKGMSPKEKAEWVRDLIAKALGVPAPKPEPETT